MAGLTRPSTIFCHTFQLPGALIAGHYAALGGFASLSQLLVSRYLNELSDLRRQSLDRVLQSLRIEYFSESDILSYGQIVRALGHDRRCKGGR